MTGPLVVCAVVAVLTLAIGGALTRLGPWYYGLSKPWWQPPGWLFGPAWTLILGLAAYAAASGWEQAASTRQRVVLAVLFGINCVLNMLWSALFFNRQRPDWALAEVPLLWLSIIAPMAALWPIDPTASLMLAPYALWVAFAAVLNRAIVRRNAPFAGVRSGAALRTPNG